MNPVISVISKMALRISTLISAFTLKDNKLRPIAEAKENV